MTIQEIVATIKAKQPEIKTVYFVGCGASMSDLFPAKYFLENNAKKLRTRSEEHTSELQSQR